MTEIRALLDRCFGEGISTTTILLSLAVILFAGFLLTRLTKRVSLPNVTGYILAGILIGPSVLGLVPRALISGMGFFSDIALSFIAFGVGVYFKKEVLRETGAGIFLITALEALLAGVLVTLACHSFFSLDWDFSVLLGAIATATAPASTMMTISQYHAKGPFVNALLQIVALDDVVCLLTFSIVAAFVKADDTGSVRASDILLPLAYNLGAILMGALLGFLLSRLITPGRSRDNRLILTVALLFLLSGLCAAVDISPLLSCMVFSTVYVNLTDDQLLYNQINAFSPPLMSIFFVISGMNLDLSTLKSAGVIGIAYFFIRIVGKYAGTWLGAAVTRAERGIRRYLGLALVPQAGVAIGLAFLGERLLPPETGSMLMTIILSSSVLYELAGPACAKGALFLSGAIPKEK